MRRSPTALPGIMRIDMRRDFCPFIVSDFT
jgi:hypothetical protein